MAGNTLDPENFDKYFESHLIRGQVGDSGEDTKFGELCELKTFEGRYNSKGERMILDGGSRKSYESLPDKAPHSALVLCKYYTRENELEYTELEIRSPHIIAALKEVVPKYKHIVIKKEKVVLRDEPRCLFHYRRELQAYTAKLDRELDAEAIKHLTFVLRYMYKTLQAEVYAYWNLFEANPTGSSIDFQHLWMIFRYGDIIYIKAGPIERTAKFLDMTRCKCDISFCRDSRWRISAQYIVYDGENLGKANKALSIQPYEGSRSIRDMNIMPLRFHPKKEEIIERMMARGKKYTRLLGKHHREYQGISEVLSKRRKDGLDGEEDEYPLHTTVIKGRIMIDAKTFYEERPPHQIYLSDENLVWKPAERGDGQPVLQEDDYLICDSEIPGFFLVDKQWCYFKLDYIKELNYNLDAWDALVLEEKQKHMVRSLVQVHAKEKAGFDDVIQGKGKGMIFLLHGVPGVGKTLTAESVADSCRRPLYQVSSGELGVSPSSVETGLQVALRLATTWNAVLLIDEADVFLLERNASDIERNALVAVFLQTLEYYNGIMFLTTNRIEAFDPAFRSRIHLAIKYPELSPESRQTLWNTFLFKALPEDQRTWVDGAVLSKLASTELNGRQIRNAVRTACAMAESEGLQLSLEHVETAVEVTTTFDTPCDEAPSGRKRSAGPDAYGEVNGRAEKKRRSNSEGNAIV